LRAIRLADSAHEDVERQLPPDRAVEFKRHDLRPVIETLSDRSLSITHTEGAGLRRWSWWIGSWGVARRLLLVFAAAVSW
jgi:hypothetical protein